MYNVHFLLRTSGIALISRSFASTPRRLLLLPAAGLERGSGRRRGHRDGERGQAGGRGVRDRVRGQGRKRRGHGQRRQRAARLRLPLRHDGLRARRRSGLRVPTAVPWSAQ